MIPLTYNLALSGLFTSEFIITKAPFSISLLLKSLFIASIEGYTFDIEKGFPVFPWEPIGPCCPVRPWGPFKLVFIYSFSPSIRTPNIPFSNHLNSRFLPGSPWMPLGPWAPFSPGEPLGPWGPCIPWGPVIPWIPASPLGPLSPWIPVSPLSPFGPMGPWGPISPLFPLGPWGAIISPIILLNSVDKIYLFPTFGILSTKVAFEIVLFSKTSLKIFESK